MRARKAAVPVVAALLLAFSAALVLVSRREVEEPPPPSAAEPQPGEGAWPEGVLSPALAASLTEIPDAPLASETPITCPDGVQAAGVLIEALPITAPLTLPQEACVQKPAPQPAQ